jgi:hypothetical protein
LSNRHFKQLSRRSRRHSPMSAIAL